MSYTNKTLKVFTALGDGFCKHPQLCPSVEDGRFSDSQSGPGLSERRQSQEGCQHEGLRGCGEHMGMSNVLTKLLLKVFERKAVCLNM